MSSAMQTISLLSAKLSLFVTRPRYDRWSAILFFSGRRLSTAVRPYCFSREDSSVSVVAAILFFSTRSSSVPVVGHIVFLDELVQYRWSAILFFSRRWFSTVGRPYCFSRGDLVQCRWSPILFFSRRSILVPVVSHIVLLDEI